MSEAEDEDYLNQDLVDEDDGEDDPSLFPQAPQTPLTLQAKQKLALLSHSLATKS